MKNARVIGFILLALAAGTMLLYWPVAGHDFVNFDDNQYIYQNPHVAAGFTWSGVRWAFGSSYASNWHPLTWISHMLDCQLYGLNPSGHHLTNLFFHVANSLLLFLLLNRLTGGMWRSACVAALFAWHPLHVESVAWASERKDVLSTFFWLLTMMAYGEYVTRPSRSRYLLALLLFVLGLMSKPMVVTLPFVLLLLDYWPLARYRRDTVPYQESVPTLDTASTSLPVAGSSQSRLSPGALLIEKLPFFVCAIAASVVTYLVQARATTMSTLEQVPLGGRLINAVVSYARYLCKTFWPSDLAVVYPYRNAWPITTVIFAALVLVVVSLLALRRARRDPYLIVGWLWFVGTLVPTIGLVKVGSQAMADRYTYIPSIGLFIALAWSAERILRSWHRGREVAVAAMAIMLGACMVCAAGQLRYWQNSETLFRHSLSVTEDNYVAECNLAEPLLKEGKLNEAAAHYSKAVTLKPFVAEAHYNLGTVLFQQSKVNEAVVQLTEALHLDPDYMEAHRNLAVALMTQGKTGEAINHFSQAAHLAPTNAEAFFNLGLALLNSGCSAEAATQLGNALRLDPDDARFHYRLAVALTRLHRVKEAISHYRTVLRLSPDFPDAFNELAWILATDPHPENRDGKGAVSLALRACQLTGNRNAEFLLTLAAAFAETGQFDQAIPTAQKAHDTALTVDDKDVAAKSADLRKLFESGRPFHQTL